MISRSAVAIFTGSACCQTFLPTASPAAPPSIAPLTWLRNVSSVGALGPPDMNTLINPAALTAQLNVSGDPEYLILTASAPTSRPARAAYDTISGLVSFFTASPLG